LRSDKNCNGILNRNEFKWTLKESGFVLTKTEYDSLFRYFDKNADDKIIYNEFLNCLKDEWWICKKNMEIII